MWIETQKSVSINPFDARVARYARAWIETPVIVKKSYRSRVARHARAWIEINKLNFNFYHILSHAVSVRGLKPLRADVLAGLHQVARRAPTWIETGFRSTLTSRPAVARHARAWIETFSL